MMASNIAASSAVGSSPAHACSSNIRRSSAAQYVVRDTFEEVGCCRPRSDGCMGKPEQAAVAPHLVQGPLIAGLQQRFLPQLYHIDEGCKSMVWLGVAPKRDEVRAATHQFRVSLPLLGIFALKTCKFSIWLRIYTHYDQQQYGVQADLRLCLNGVAQPITSCLSSAITSQQQYHLTGHQRNRTPGSLCVTLDNWSDGRCSQPQPSCGARSCDSCVLALGAA
jgi:hypothetical protein